MPKVLKSHHVFFFNAFKSPGSTWEQDAETFQVSESYVFRLYGRKLKKVNEAHYKISKKYMGGERYSRFVPSSIMLGNIKTSLQAFIFCFQIVEAVSSESY